jgi:hypothetical protein
LRDYSRLFGACLQSPNRCSADEVIAAVQGSGIDTTRKRLAARIDSANWSEADSNAAAR